MAVGLYSIAFGFMALSFPVARNDFSLRDVIFPVCTQGAAFFPWLFSGHVSHVHVIIIGKYS